VSKRKPAEFEIRIRSVPSEIPWAVRMRSMLKVMLRGYQFRVVSYRRLENEENEPQPDESVDKGNRQCKE